MIGPAVMLTDTPDMCCCYSGEFGE